MRRLTRHEHVSRVRATLSHKGRGEEGPADFADGKCARPLKCAGPADTVDPHGPKNEKTPMHFLVAQVAGWVNVRKIYKICPASAWREAERQGVFRGSPVDISDGFIHFSTAAQVEKTARKHFFGQAGLFLIEVDGDALGAALRWERSRNNELFPHLYGELDLGAVVGVLSMRTRSDGTHDMPELEP
jgi:uncharacterized protein (DUF952 family)